MAGPVPISIEAVRSSLGAAVRARVSGGADENAHIFAAPGPRWFAEGSAIRLVHSDASMFVGGLRALVLQGLHPLAMAGVAEHSGYRGDPWGRLQRTSEFLATTTFGPVPMAERAVERVRRIHRTVHGTAPDGRAYRADDPGLLRWVHLTEVDSFLRAYRRFGASQLTAAQGDEYVADVGFVSAQLGVVDPPQTVADLDAALHAFRPELRGTPAAREAARYLVFNPPIPLLARPAYGLVATAAVSMLPWWARRMLRLPPPLPVADGLIGGAAGVLVTQAFRWALAPRRAAPPT